MQKINWHNVNMYSGLVAAFLIAGLQAVHVIFSPSAAAFLDGFIIPGLLLIEHSTNGNTGNGGMM